MLHIDNLCGFVKEIMDTEATGLHFPQDPIYICTSQMVQEIARRNGKKILLTKVFNPLLKLFSGKVNTIDKVFGGLVYSKDTIDNLLQGSDL